MEDLLDHFEATELHIDNEVATHLAYTSRWTKFIGITFFIACGLILIFAVIAGASSSGIFLRSMLNLYGDFWSGIVIFLIVAIITVLGLMAYWLVNFADKVRIGLQTENTELLNKGFNSMRLYFILAGSFSILALLINLLKLSKYF